MPSKWFHFFSFLHTTVLSPMHAAWRDCLISFHLQTLIFCEMFNYKALRYGLLLLFCCFLAYQLKYSPSSLTHSQVSRPYRTTGIIMISFICIYTCFNRGRDDKRCWTKGRKHPWNLICSYFSFRRSEVWTCHIYERSITIFLLHLLHAFSCPDMNTEAYLVPSAPILWLLPPLTSF